MEQGQSVFDEHRKERSGGLPWFTILDGDGAELISSNGKEGANVGCPVAPHELAHFAEMIKKTSDHDDAYFASLDEALKKHAKKFER